MRTRHGAHIKVRLANGVWYYLSDSEEYETGVATANRKRAQPFRTLTDARRRAQTLTEHVHFDSGDTVEDTGRTPPRFPLKRVLDIEVCYIERRRP